MQKSLAQILASGLALVLALVLAPDIERLLTSVVSNAKMKKLGVIFLTTATLLTIFVTKTASAQGVDPKIHFKVIESPHFSVIFDSQHRLIAELYSDYAEEAYASLITQFNQQAPEKTVIFIDDVSDQANGAAVGIPYSMITAFAVLPGPTDPVSDYGNWGRELLMHEYTHILNFEPANGSFKIFRCEFAAANVIKRCLIRSNHAGPRPGFDRHVAHRHPLFHGQRLNGGTGIFQHIAGSTLRSDLTNEVQNQILGRYATSEMSVDAQFKRLRFVLKQRLRREHMFHLARPDAECQRPERTVRSRVTISANDRHPRLGVASFRTNDVHDPLVGVVQIVEPDAKLFAVLPQGVHLLTRNRIGNRQQAIGRRDIVIGRGNGFFRPPYFSSRQTQSFERLSARHFMHQLKVNIDNRGLPWFFVDEVLVPDLLEHRSRGGSVRGHKCAAERRILWRRKKTSRSQNAHGASQRPATIIFESRPNGELVGRCIFYPLFAAYVAA